MGNLRLDVTSSDVYFYRPQVTNKNAPGDGGWLSELPHGTNLLSPVFARRLFFKCKILDIVINSRGNRVLRQWH